MWLFGIITGAIIGAIGAGAAGALIGGVIGGVGGWVIAEQRAIQDRLHQLGNTLLQLDVRLKALEDRVSATEKVVSSSTPEPARAAPMPSREERTHTPLAAEWTLGSAPRSEEAPEELEHIAGDTPQMAFTPESTIREHSMLEPRQPSALWNFFFGVNSLVRFGVIVLFFGVAFL